MSGVFTVNLLVIFLSRTWMYYVALDNVFIVFTVLTIPIIYSLLIYKLCKRKSINEIDKMRIKDL